MSRLTVLLPLLVSACLPAFAALPPLSPSQKTASAEAIITGKVTRAVIEIDRLKGRSIYRITLQANVEEVEKGNDLVKASDTIAIHCRRLRAAPGGWAGPSGHHDIPGEGSEFRAWITQNDDGIWEPLEPNGFELINDSAELSFAAAEKSMHKGFLLLTVIGVAFILAIFLYASRGRRS